MNKNDVRWTIEWDYKGYTPNIYNNFNQSDWNQTLINKINQISANIHKHTRLGGANCILLNSKLNGLLQTLEFYHDGYIVGGYRVIVDDSSDFDTIFVYNDKPSQDTYTRITNDVIRILRRSDNEVEYEEFIKNHYGCITIKNYFTFGR